MAAMPIYLDYNATTPCDPRVLEAMMPWFTRQFGNAASHQHAYGWEAAGIVDQARESVADLLGAEPGEIIFTSGATESVNLALKGIAEAYAGKRNHIITCATEHKAVLDTCHWLEKKGTRITRLGVDRQGRISMEELKDAITPETLALAIMTANNETGVIHPIEEMGALAHEHKILFFTDATQAAGKIPLEVNRQHVDLLALSAHKFYGPKGMGALYVRRRNPRVSLLPLLHGGGHEKGWRSGTLNVPAIAGLSMACRIAREEMNSDALRLGQLRNDLEQQLLGLGEVQINAAETERLPHVSHITIGHVPGKSLLAGLARELAVAAGSACTSASPDPSHVLKAMGLADEEAAASLRLSLGRPTTAGEISAAVTILRRQVQALRSLNPAWPANKRP